MSSFRPVRCGSSLLDSGIQFSPVVLTVLHAGGRSRGELARQQRPAAQNEKFDIK